MPNCNLGDFNASIIDLDIPLPNPAACMNQIIDVDGLV